jgi:CRP/FNR family nitrogen fixation transcriptional regulator
LKARFGPTSCYLTVAARLAPFTYPAKTFGLENGDVHRFTAEAIVDSTLRLVKRESLERVAKSEPTLIRSLLMMTTNNLQHIENRLLLLGRKTAPERVAAFLLEMNGRLPSRDVMALPMTRRDFQTTLALPSRRCLVCFLHLGGKVT